MILAEIINRILHGGIKIALLCGASHGVEFFDIAFPAVRGIVGHKSVTDSLFFQEIQERQCRRVQAGSFIDCSVHIQKYLLYFS